jgi:hypothetical protein
MQTSIIEATQKVAEVSAAQTSEWFKRSKETLFTRNNTRNFMILHHIKKPSHHNKALLQAAHHHLKREKQWAKISSKSM